jgi:hypothetical protein
LQPILHAGRQLPILLGEIFGIADDRMTDAEKAEEPLSGYVGFWHISALELVVGLSAISRHRKSGGR